MRALVLSDIHSNPLSLQAIWEKEKSAVDVVYCAGDLTDYGPYPEQVIDFVREKGWICVQGNHDRYVIEAYRRKEKTGEPLVYPCNWVDLNSSRLGEEHISYLESLPRHYSFELDGHAYLLQHQLRDGSYDTVESREQFTRFWREHVDSTLINHPSKRMIFGHSHRLCIHTLAKDMLWLNPGSTSYRRPDDTDKRAHYAILADGEIELHTLAYDRSPLLAITQTYHQNGILHPQELQVAYSFFGESSTDAPLPPILPQPKA